MLSKKMSFGPKLFQKTKQKLQLSLNSNQHFLPQFCCQLKYKDVSFFFFLFLSVMALSVAKIVMCAFCRLDSIGSNQNSSKKILKKFNVWEDLVFFSQALVENFPNLLDPPWAIHCQGIGPWSEWLGPALGDRNHS